MLAERLKKRRKEMKLSQEYIANKLGITRQGYGHYETGRNEPDNDTLLKISNILDCTSDYLLGKTDRPQGHTDFDPIAEHNRLLKKYGIEDSGFFDIEKWKQMGPEDLKQLEDYFEFIVSKAKEREKEDKDSE